VGIAERTRRPFVFFWWTAALLVLGIVGYYSYVNFFSDSRLSNNKSNQPGQNIATKQSVPEKKDASAGEKLVLPSSSPVNDNINANDAHVSKNETSKNSHLKRDHDFREPVSPGHNENDQLIEDFTVTQQSNNYREPQYSLPIAGSQVFSMRSFAPPKLSSQSDLNTSEKIPSLPVAKKSKWEYGIDFSAGLSNLGNGLLKVDSSSPVYYNPSTNSLGTASDVKNGLSFSIGGTISKWIGAKWKIGIGLGYQYFSNSIRIGQKVDSAIFVNQSSVTISTVRGYYRPSGNTPYHNQYHFISLPVTVNWQFAPQFSWENQAIYSRLIATNALHFDASNGAYYKDREIFNDNQFLFATALKFGWDKNKFQVGPQLQYAFTNLFNEGEGSIKHLTFLGIKSNMRLSKN
jgi:hypothetical protein